MPQQEIFFGQEVEHGRIEVLKTYDRAFAQEAFEHMDEAALRFLHKSLNLSVEYESAEKVELHNQEFLDLLWEEIEDGAREDWNKFSYFVVVKTMETVSSPVYVSSDWPSAEAFAGQLLSGIQAATR